MCKIKRELRSIRSRIEIMNKITEDMNISLVGINDGDSNKILGELITVLKDNIMNSSVLVITENTYIQTSYRIRGLLPQRIASLEYKGMMSIMLSETNFNIDILNIDSNRLTDEMILHYEYVIFQFPDRDSIDISRISKWASKNTKSRIIVTVECPTGKEIGFFKIMKLRKYVDNVLFMMYDELEGDTCFVDIFKRKHTLYTVK